MLRHNNRLVIRPPLFVAMITERSSPNPLSRRKTPLHDSSGPVNEVICSIDAQGARQSGIGIGGP